MNNQARNLSNPPRQLSTAAMRRPSDIELEKIAKRIKDRDLHLEESAKSHWLKNGIDLIDAKKLVGHGNFEEWCDKELSYSKSKAEKLMRAAVVLGPNLISVKLTDLPPPALAFTLSARSVPQEIRDSFLPRIIAGEKVGPDVRAAVKKYREKANQGEQQPGTAPRVHAAQQGDVVAQDCDAEEQALEAEQRPAAFLKALDLILRLVGNELSALMYLLDRAGPGAIFVSAAESFLRNHSSLSTNSAVDSFEDIDAEASARN